MSRHLTQDAALSAAVVDQLSSWPLSNSFLQSIQEQCFRHLLPSNVQHLTPPDSRQKQGDDILLQDLLGLATKLPEKYITQRMRWYTCIYVYTVSYCTCTETQQWGTDYGNQPLSQCLQCGICKTANTGFTCATHLQQCSLVSVDVKF